MIAGTVDPAAFERQEQQTLVKRLMQVFAACILANVAVAIGDLTVGSDPLFPQLPLNALQVAVLMVAVATLRRVGTRRTVPLALLVLGISFGATAISGAWVGDELTTRLIPVSATIVCAVILPWQTPAQLALATLAAAAVLANAYLLHGLENLGYPHVLLTAILIASIYISFELGRTRRENLRVKRSLAEEARDAAALVGVAEAIAFEIDTATLCQRVCEQVVRVLGCEFGHVFRLDPQTDTFEAIAGYGDGPEQWRSVASERVAASVVRDLLDELENEGAVELVADQLDHLIGASLRRLGTATVMFVPLQQGETVFGVLSAGYRTPGIRFDTLQQRIMKDVGRLATLALQKAILVEELERSETIQKMFAATLSHEIRNTINRIFSYSEMLLADADEGKTTHGQNWLSAIHHSAYDAAGVIEAALQISRSDVAEAPLDPQEIDLGELLAEVVGELRGSDGKRAVAVSAEVEPEHCRFCTDGRWLRIIVRNLLGNAIKFTRRGEIEVRARVDQGAAVISVRDSGIGIPSEEIPHLFAPFQQAHGRRSRRAGGIGLGLYIVQRSVQRLGGEISVESVVGEGSTFEVRIPALRGVTLD